MKNIYFLFFALIFLNADILAQSLQQAPTSKTYLNYLNQKTGLKSSSTKNKFGYIPHPVGMHFDKNIANRKKSTTTLPSKYDLRDYGWVSSVKNQGSSSYSGNCWAFATMGSIESNWLMRGFGNSNLSEQNIITCHGFEWGYGDGGNEYLSCAYLSRLSGPISDSDDPYNTSSHSCTTGFTPVAFVPEMRWVTNDEEVVKQAIMEYGGVMATMYWKDASYKESNYTYYYSGSESPNHEILIVGWDDTKSTLGGTGAWIVKNSWGSSWGNAGYFYASYNDKVILNSGAYMPARETKTAFDTVYYNDKLGYISSFGFGKVTANGLVKYHAPEKQLIKRIGTYAVSSNTIIDIEVYAQKDADTLKNLIASSRNNYCELPGFYTFDVPCEIDSDFYVKVKYSVPDYYYPIPVEAAYSGFAAPDIELSGTQWIGRSDTSWIAIGSDTDYDVDLCIKVYAVDSAKATAIIKASETEVCAGSDITFENAIQQSGVNYSWNFGSQASPSTATGTGPHTVNYPTADTTFVQLVASDGTNTDTSWLKVYSVTSLSVNAYADKSTLSVKDSTILHAIANAETFSWSPETYLNSTSGDSVTFKCSTAGTYQITLTATQGECSGTATTSIIVNTPPDNDDVCNAAELQIGDNGTFTNVNATVEYNEPMPTLVDCEAALSWCEEGGLQNSVWFKFTAPSTGYISIITHGMDNQLALYETKSCDSLLSGNYELIAANDDYFSADYAAAINKAAVTPGEVYYLQSDGSAGGTEGSFTVELTEYGIGITEYSDEDLQIQVLPNPTTGSFILQYKGINAGQTSQITITNNLGQQLFTQQITLTSEEYQQPFDLSGQPRGIYYVRVVTNNQVFVKKVIKN
jgi:C1A family cysteine protease